MADYHQHEHSSSGLHGGDHEQADPHRAVGAHHEHGSGPHKHQRGAWWSELLHLHSHDHTHMHGLVQETSQRGIWALKVSLLSLGITAALQVLIVILSGSVALLADTIHNFADALTALPLWIAFALNRRRAPRGFTYRYGKAEDLAGTLVVLIIAISAAVVFYEAWQKLVNPAPLRNLGWVAAAGIIGFLGNEAAAYVRIRVGRQIGSAALVADGLHARVDGLTSLAVVLGAAGVWLGFPLADPLIGLLIGVAILFIVRDAARSIWRRLMDAVDPDLVEEMAHTTAHVEGVRGVHDVRLRWIGHALWGELHIEVDGALSTVRSHQIVEQVRHALYHTLPRLQEITVHVDPCPCPLGDANGHHTLTLHHMETE